MTTERAIETISKLLTRSKEYGLIRMTSNEKQALDKAIEVMGNNNECQHPYYLVSTSCMGEINECLACGERL